MTDERLQRWFDTAYEGELTTLQQLPDENPQRPNSAFFASLLRLCAVMKGTDCRYKNRDELQDEVVAIVHGQLGLLTAKEVERQFANAWRKARPRRPT